MDHLSPNSPDTVHRNLNMGPVAKYVRIRNSDVLDDQQNLLELSPTVRTQDGRRSATAKDDRSSPWNAECITRLLFLFIVSMIACGYLIRYLPQQFDPHESHHQDVFIQAAEHHHKTFHKAAVAAGQHECSVVGKDILKAGGNAVDAAIATMLCQGVVEPYFTGIGGGAIFTIFNSTTKSTTCIIAREKAPAASTREMYIKTSHVYGPTLIAVPGELRGIEYAYRKYGGRVEWADLFEPAIRKARDGFRISGSMAEKFSELWDRFVKGHTDSVLCDIYCNKDRTGLKKFGDIVKNTRLANFLTKIQQEGVDAFYKGEIANKMIEEIQGLGGIMTTEDLQDFDVYEEPAIEINLPNAGYTVHTAPLPLGGPVLGGILSIMDLYDIKPSDYRTTPSLQIHRTIEAFRHAYGIRYHMGDPKFVPNATQIVKQITSGLFAKEAKKKIFDDKTFHDPKYYGAGFYHGGASSTSHISVLDPNQNAVAVTSTVNWHWGSGVMSPSTGVLFNNEMADFSYPDGDPEHDAHMSPANQIQGGKRPLSSMSPSVFVNDKQEPVFIIGAAGGIMIPTSVAQVMLRLLYFGDDDFDEPIEERRLHDNLLPDELTYEHDFDPKILGNLKKIGHNLKLMTDQSHVNGIKYHTSHIHAFSDLRNKGAGPSGW